MNVNNTTDFYVLDNLEPVTLAAPGGSETLLPAALCRPADWKEAEPAAGNVLEGDQVWAWPIAAMPAQPPLGASVVDGNSNRWTVLAVKSIANAGIWELHTRNLAVVNNLDNLATVLVASYSKSPGGELVATWSTQVENIPARFQPAEQDAKILEGADWPQTVYRVLLGTDIFAPEIPVEPASADYRLMDSAGRHYRIVKYQRPARIDALPVAVCVLIIEGSEGGAIER